MQFIVKLSPEITIKSRPVRKRCILMLKNNVKKHFDFNQCDADISGNWDRIVVKPYLEDESEKIKEVLKSISGIAYFLEVEEYSFNEGKPQTPNPWLLIEETISEKVKEYYAKKVEGKTFVVRVNRSGTHSFTSIDLERHLGGVLLKATNNSKVKLKNPDVTVSIEIKDDKFFIVKNRIEGLGGYPVGFQDRVVSLISGGFDSTVSSFEMNKRGCQVDFLFFNLGGSAHELGVKQVSYYLWKTFGLPHKRARFISVPFEGIIEKLLTKVNHKYRGIILKRYMLKVANMVSKGNYYAVIKGDSLGQVSSQTLKNMDVIDKASDNLVLRPLISRNKQEIVDISKEIGTYDFASNMPEYCGVISDKPATGAKLEIIEKEEENIDKIILDEAFENRKICFVKDMFDGIDSEVILEGNDKIDVLYEVGENDIVIDVRESEKIKKMSLIIKDTDILEIPFYEINHKFKNLDQSKNYLLYCDKGVLSRLHGLYLKEKGFDNISVYRPDNK